MEGSILASSSGFPEVSTVRHYIPDIGLSLKAKIIFTKIISTKALARNRSCKIVGKIYLTFCRAHKDGYFSCRSFGDIYLVAISLFSWGSEYNWNRQCVFSLVA